MTLIRIGDKKFGLLIRLLERIQDVPLKVQKVIVWAVANTIFNGPEFGLRSRMVQCCLKYQGAPHGNIDCFVDITFR